MTHRLGFAILLLASSGGAMAQTRPITDQPWREFQYLYGSAESAAASLQAFNALRVLMAQRVDERRMGKPLMQVVLASGSTLDRPTFETCGDKPLAAVFDVDETLLLNVGFEYAAAASPDTYEQSQQPTDPAAFKAKWRRWERGGIKKVAAVPGAVALVGALRAMDVTVIMNTNRTAENNSQDTVDAIRYAGLGDVKLGETLFTDAIGDSNKDSRRAEIARKWCVVAMAGDQLTDFTELFNPKPFDVGARRQATFASPLASLWGNGWFVLPNPVYGKAVRGTFADVFPDPALRWTDGPAPAPSPAPARLRK